MNFIKDEHKKKKVKQLKLIGGADDYEKLMKELIMAIVDSLVRFYKEDNRDDKQKRRISYAGIKGKKIQETFFGKSSSRKFLDNAGESRNKINNLKNKSLKDIMDVLKKYNELSSNDNTKSGDFVNKTTANLIGCIGNINNQIQIVSEDLNNITGDLASAPPYDKAKVTPKRTEQ